VVRQISREIKARPAAEEVNRASTLDFVTDARREAGMVASIGGASRHYKPILDFIVPGFYIVHGPGGRGKSVTMRALELAALAHSVPAAYSPIQEPRGHFLMATPEVNAQQEDLVATAGNLAAGSTAYTKFLTAGLNVMKATADRGKTTPLWILDSVTFCMTSLDETRAQLKNYSGSTYVGGLNYADTLGALCHQARAEEASTAVFGVLNDQLYPVASLLAGACEGCIQVIAPGVIDVTSREMGRLSRRITLPDEVMTLAFATISTNTARALVTDNSIASDV
jgi:hypothetical protein